MIIWSIQIQQLIQTNVIQSISNPNRTRVKFLNETFCGKFFTDNWTTTVDPYQIKAYNRFLRQKIQTEIWSYKNQSCVQFIETNGFYATHITNVEYKNPMAFSILVYKNFYQFQVLMRTLYTRTNFHCIHVDSTSSENFYQYAVKLSSCLENVFLASSRQSVVWGTMDILVVERICQKELLNRSSKWHYYMTIAGTELPIQTNLNRIQILQLIPDKSRNDISSFPQPYNRQSMKKSSPPGNITVYKGEFHSILTRTFIEAVHTNRFALEFWSYLNLTEIPDEQFYPSLVHSAELPGGKERGSLSYTHSKLFSHYKSWSDQIFPPCLSKQYDRLVCQFNYKDLANIEQSGRLFANKFNENLDVISIDCWGKWFDIKRIDHKDIHSNDFIDRFPFTRRINQSTTNLPQI